MDESGYSSAREPLQVQFLTTSASIGGPVTDWVCDLIAFGSVGVLQYLLKLPVL